MDLNQRNILNPPECPRLRKTRWVGPFPETDTVAWRRASRCRGTDGQRMARPNVNDPLTKMIALWISRSVPIRWAMLVGAAALVARGSTAQAIEWHLRAALRLSGWWRKHPNEMPNGLPLYRYGHMDGPRKQTGHALWRSWMVRRVALAFAHSMSEELYQQHPAGWWLPYRDYFNGVVSLPQAPLDAPPDLRMVLRNGMLPPTCQNEVKLAASIRNAIRCSQQRHADLIGPKVQRARWLWWSFDKAAREQQSRPVR